MNIPQEYKSVFNQDLSETIAYNNPLFPVYARFGLLSKYDYCASSHWHDDLEFIIIKKGHMLYNVNGTITKLCKGEGIIVNSRQLHFGFSENNTECEFICILISPELLKSNKWFYENCISPVTENYDINYIYLKNNSWHKEILDRINNIYFLFSRTNSDNSFYFDIFEDIIYIMKTLFANISFNKKYFSKEPEDTKILKKMLVYIEENYNENISLKKLAAEGSCCIGKCTQLFKKYLNDTPIIYIIKYRLRKSLSFLLETDKTVSETAENCGFSSTSYYCETFSRYYGISPLKYRQLFKKT